MDASPPARAMFCALAPIAVSFWEIPSITWLARSLAMTSIVTVLAILCVLLFLFAFRGELQRLQPFIAAEPPGRSAPAGDLPGRAAPFFRRAQNAHPIR